MKNKIKFGLIILIGINMNMFSQTILKLNVEDEYSYEGKLINKNENFVVKSTLVTNLSNELQVYCDSLQSTFSNKYLDHTYTFFQYETGVLDENVSLSSENLYNYKNKIIAILIYHQTRNNGLEKRFMLIENPVKYYVNGIEKPRLN